MQQEKKNNLKSVPLPPSLQTKTIKNNGQLSSSQTADGEKK
jgi:hypothetical protein